jgi:hypothetical protein
MSIEKRPIVRRPYNISDVFAFRKILSGVVRSSGDKLRGILKADNVGGADETSEAASEESGIKLAEFILCECLDVCEYDLKDWFASLCCMEREEFLSLPPQELLDLVEDIVTRPESKDFFECLSAIQADRRFREYHDRRINGVLAHWRLLPSQLAAVPFADYLRMASALDAAFTAWLMGAGGEKTWPQFCERLGLSEREKPKPAKMSKEEVKDLYAWAEGVAAGFGSRVAG